MDAHAGVPVGAVRTLPAPFGGKREARRRRRVLDLVEHRTPRELGTNPRATRTNDRAAGLNPRALHGRQERRPWLHDYGVGSQTPCEQRVVMLAGVHVGWQRAYLPVSGEPAPPASKAPKALAEGEGT